MYFTQAREGSWPFGPHQHAHPSRIGMWHSGVLLLYSGELPATLV